MRKLQGVNDRMVHKDRRAQLLQKLKAKTVSSGKRSAVNYKRAGGMSLRAQLKRRTGRYRRAPPDGKYRHAKNRENMAISEDNKERLRILLEPCHQKLYELFTLFPELVAGDFDVTRWDFEPDTSMFDGE